ncbi:MAG: XdhC family protein [Akkermansiaceae bacterium]|nr:XdhC family protein [Akkermansiaceae bacterium]MCP5546402.1 XdhC family protein [Akkermansiaceae bacterium]
MTSDWHLLLGFLRCHATSGLALATLVSREGSSYRQPGARMLVAADGARAGSLSGGCLEEGVAAVAEQVLADGVARVEHIDTRPHFGCPGKLTILIEKLAPGFADDVSRRVTARETFRIATSETGSRVGDGKGFVETVGPRPRLVAVGWTSDQDPLFQMASILGWECHRIVRDPRIDLHPVAGETISAPAAAALRETFVPDAKTAVLVMSHHLATDLAFLKAAVMEDYGYIGLLGSRRRREELLGELGAGGFLEDDGWTRRFHAPVGLDLGAENPPSIALSILAEIQAVLSGHDAGFLRDRLGRIHLPAACP